MLRKPHFYSRLSYYYWHCDNCLVGVYTAPQVADGPPPQFVTIHLIHCSACSTNWLHCYILTCAQQ
jgi:hypothetical protein